tara:strand:- start:66 stop:374 length:309 start_codon:yes stop_codon:yes gene_type:complete
MAIGYEWEILTLEHKISDGGVFVASWKCSGGEATSGCSAVSYGTCIFTYDASSSDFTPYQDLTQAQVQGWIWEKVNQTNIEADIAAGINAQISAASAGGVPW